MNSVEQIEDYIRQFGYPVEPHEIKTEDGYILKYHRIPYGKSTTKTTVKRKPVILQHGLLSSSAVWVCAAYSFGYSLADAGFDVWLGNSRGNTYSRKHTEYDPNNHNKMFWDFSWHEMGYYDLPASIDYVLNTTNSKQLFYIGHSMGTTMYFVMGATRPEYTDKVQAMVAMSPMVFPQNMRSGLAILSLRALPVLKWTFNMKEEVMPQGPLSWLTHIYGFNFVCRFMVFFITGFNTKGLDLAVFSTILEFLPAGTSFKLFQHSRQIIEKGSDFKQFDYGAKGNKEKYDSVHPPVYNLANIRSPIYIYYSANDWLSTFQDIQHLVDLLPSIQNVSKVPDEQFNHGDFMWGNSAKTLLYDDIISKLHEMSSK